MGATNPIVPIWWDPGLVLLAVATLLWFVVTLVSIARSRLTVPLKLVCALLALAMPIIGGIVWFASRKTLERSVSRTC
jgi:hypothetical protein